MLAGVFSPGHALYAIGPGLFVAVFCLVGTVPVVVLEWLAGRRELERRGES